MHARTRALHVAAGLVAVRSCSRPCLPPPFLLAAVRFDAARLDLRSECDCLSVPTRTSLPPLPPITAAGASAEARRSLSGVGPGWGCCEPATRATDARSQRSGEGEGAAHRALAASGSPGAHARSWAGWGGGDVDEVNITHKYTLTHSLPSAVQAHCQGRRGAGW
eukprot:350065-Chlamydomonas_euryale.AAC.5